MKANDLKIAVVLHLYHEKQWSEFVRYLANIPHPFNLFVSLQPESRFADTIYKAYPDAVIRTFPNVGRDVGPFLGLLPELQPFDVVCKLHTKSKVGVRRKWGQAAVGSLVGSQKIVETYLAAFAANDDLVIGGPKLLYLDGEKHLGGSNWNIMRRFCAARPESWGFFAGTMFWCRPQLFSEMAEQFNEIEFVEHKKFDGQPEHAAERLFGIIPALEQKQLMLLGETVEIDVAANLEGHPDWFEVRRTHFKQKATVVTAKPEPTDTDALSLQELHNRHDGYVSDKWSNNLAQYDRFLVPYRKQGIRLLEIGIQNGGSLELWSKYFRNGKTFIGCDINPACERLSYADPRINVIIGDANAPQTQTQIRAKSDAFDIVIDDASHRSEDIVKSFLTYFPMIADGGLFVAEDLHCSYWRSFQGGLNLDTSSLSFFRSLTDVINFEHWEKQGTVASRFAAFETAYGVSVDPDILQQVVSVEFANSMAIVRKGTASEARLGKRSVAGSKALVDTGVLKFKTAQ
ncbi:rhamnan synthesis F family protein [Yoonia litorea]|uniref:Methyltransferase domain-containing protein n=1 Tax=Yoonia litorea TaxID=1123755 RepID=A0A1I6N2H1_9RHOB|nr:rhamnan synthesis F family protein [Yoonia litorea]SFS22061.1 Methyltransferase domain-containing protein [Yoonia litorea]